MGRDYPLGAEYFQNKCRNAFQKKIGLTDPQEIDKSIHLGNYIVKEIEALYALRKYRAMKKRYYDEESQAINLLQQDIDRASVQ